MNAFGPLNYASAVRISSRRIHAPCRRLQVGENSISGAVSWIVFDAQAGDIPGALLAELAQAAAASTETLATNVRSEGPTVARRGDTRVSGKGNAETAGRTVTDALSDLIQAELVSAKEPSGQSHAPCRKVFHGRHAHCSTEPGEEG